MPTEILATPTIEASSATQPTLSPAERNYEWTAAEAVTVELDATEEEIQQAMESTLSAYFPLTENPEFGTFGFYGLLTSISYLEESAYVRAGDFAVTVTGRLRYLDADEDTQEITVAVVIENLVERTVWVPYASEAVSTHVPSQFAQEFFEAHTDGFVKPGTVVNLQFGLPNLTNQQATLGALHHGELVANLYELTSLENFIQTGDAENLGGLLVPYLVSQRQTNQPSFD